MRRDFSQAGPEPVADDRLENRLRGERFWALPWIPLQTQRMYPLHSENHDSSSDSDSYHKRSLPSVPLTVVLLRSRTHPLPVPSTSGIQTCSSAATGSGRSRSTHLYRQPRPLHGSQAAVGHNNLSAAQVL